MNDSSARPAGDYLHELKEFLSFSKSLWGLLAGISVFFPLSNVLLAAIPLRAYGTEDGVFDQLSPHLLTTVASVVTLFVLLVTFSGRGRFADRRRRASLLREACCSLAVGLLSLLLYVGIYRGYSAYAWEPWGWGSGDPRKLLAEIPLLIVYVVFFASLTRAFMLVAMIEFFGPTALASDSEADHRGSRLAHMPVMVDAPDPGMRRSDSRSATLLAVRAFSLAFSVAYLLTACVPASPPLAAAFSPADLRQPEGESGLGEPREWRGSTFAVATAHPLASAAGARMLQAGGAAIDAAVAAQMVLTLVEPQSSGIGGGAFLLHYDGRRVTAFDGRETAPGAVTETLFLDAAGQPLPFDDAAVGGRAVGVPGVLRLLEMAHADYGRLPWSELFAPAIELAEEGFPVGRRLHALLEADPHLRREPRAAAYFYDKDGQPPAVGSRLRNPELAALLRRIAAEGSPAFYHGDVARGIVAQVREHARNPGYLTMRDLAGYRPQRRAALCSGYAPRNVEPPRRYRICGFPPPGSGAIAVAQILGILEHTPAPELPFADPQWLHYYTEASRLAFADRAQYIADPDFVAAPAGAWLALLGADYLAERAKQIGGLAMRHVAPGAPTADGGAHAPMPEQAEHGTSHLSIVDAYGNALAMTTSIENAFGARQFVSGFLLNNQLTDFSFVPRDEYGHPIANRVEPGKRPRSSMNPILVFDEDSGELVLSGGSPGGTLIIHYTAKLLYGILRMGLSPQQAIDLPNFGVIDGVTLLERGHFAPPVFAALRDRQHDVKEIAMTSGVQAIGKRAGSYLGGVDPRREGQVLGQ